MILGQNDLLETARKGLDGTITRAEVAVTVICLIGTIFIGVFA